MKTKNNGEKLYLWETALLIALCVTLCFGLWQRARQRELAGQVIRLHVVARSDSDRDQAIKLRVRDEVLRTLEPALEGVGDIEEAAGRVEELLPAVEAAANAAALASGELGGAEVSLSEESYPTRHYEGFALPPGEYVSLRVVLGEGRGQNWWCVVFPPLCAATAEEAQSAMDALSEDSEAMIVAEDGEYKLSFRVLELFEKLKELLE